MTYRFNIIIYMLRVKPANRMLLITKTQINMTNNKISSHLENFSFTTIYIKHVFLPVCRVHYKYCTEAQSPSGRRSWTGCPAEPEGWPLIGQVLFLFPAAEPQAFSVLSLSLL